MRLSRAVVAIALLATAAPASPSPRYLGPIIDVHLHSYPAEGYKPVPMAATTDFLPPALAASMSPPTAEAHRLATLAELRRLNVTTALVSVDVPASVSVDEAALAESWRKADRHIRVGLSAGPLLHRVPPDTIAGQFQRHEIVALAELQLQYEGLAADDPRLEPYWAMADANDIPVGIHTGTGPSRSANGTTPAFRTRFGDPRTLEEVLIRHPKLRMWIMHAGWPYLAETKVMLQQYPELYADISVIDWVLPAAEFNSYLKSLIDAGFGDRLMFGSDQMLWPQAIGMAVDAVNGAPFLTMAQKQAILHDNATRFLRLGPEG